MHPHFSRNMAQQHMSIFQLDTKCCVRQVFHNFTLHLDDIFLRHQRPIKPFLKFAFLSMPSY